jgi:hypothetical protein
VTGTMEHTLITGPTRPALAEGLLERKRNTEA